MRPIDADALCEDLLKRWSVAETRKEELIQTVMSEIVTPIIASQPTIELPERKTGRWIYNSPVTMKCDQCGLVIKDSDWHKFKYCPNCGRRMEGDEE